MTDRRRHKVHQLRAISKAADGSAVLLGCALCDYTETRRYGIGKFRRRPSVDPMGKK